MNVFMGELVAGEGLTVGTVARRSGATPQAVRQWLRVRRAELEAELAELHEKRAELADLIAEFRARLILDGCTDPVLTRADADPPHVRNRIANLGGMGSDCGTL